MWKNDYFKTAVAIVLIVAVVLGFIIGLPVGLHTSDPALTVESGSMSIPYDGADNFWLSILHPFDRTLSIGDIIIVQGVPPQDLNPNYPNSDIIVFHPPGSSDPSLLIVHRITSEEVVNGTYYFFTKGDGNPPVLWPANVSADTPDPSWYNPEWYDEHPGVPNGAVPQSMVVGKVVMRIPWLGWITLAMRNTTWGLPLIIFLIMLLIIVEFVIPILREKKPEQQNPRQIQVQMYLYGEFLI